MASTCILLPNDIVGNIYNRYHNIDYSSNEVTIHPMIVQRMLDEWIICDLYKAVHNIKPIYYEDIIFKSSVYRKNTGHELVKITNIDFLQNQYRIYMDSRK